MYLRFLRCIRHSDQPLPVSPLSGIAAMTTRLSCSTSAPISSRFIAGTTRTDVFYIPTSRVSSYVVSSLRKTSCWFTISRIPKLRKESSETVRTSILAFLQWSGDSIQTDSAGFHLPWLSSRCCSCVTTLPVLNLLSHPLCLVRFLSMLF